MSDLALAYLILVGYLAIAVVVAKVTYTVAYRRFRKESGHYDNHTDAVGVAGLFAVFWPVVPFFWLLIKVFERPVEWIGKWITSERNKP